jgi:hypothetical protein
MPTMRLTGTITARSPIMITRLEQGASALTMNVIKNQALTQVPVLPGETIKGLLRNLAFSLCVDAALQSGEVKTNLDQFYKQTLGGLAFVSETVELGADIKARVGEPILSLFGAASPRLTGRIVVHHALAQDVTGSQEGHGIGLSQGFRRDGVMSHPQFVELLDNEGNRGKFPGGRGSQSLESVIQAMNDSAAA